VIDESGGTGQGYDLLYVDTDNDNRLEDSERILFELGTTRGSPPLHIALDITTAGKTARHHFKFSSFLYTDDNNPVEKIHANLRNGSCYAGEAVFGGKQRRIVIADLDSNGLFNDVERGIFDGDRFFVDMSEDGSDRPEGKNLASYPYGQYTKIIDTWYSVTATPDGSRVEIVRATPTFGTVKGPTHLAAVTLYSSTQKQTLDLSKGSSRALVGTYKLLSVTVRETDDENGIWELQGNFRSGSPTVAVEKEGTTRIKAGPPFRVAINPLRTTKEGAVELKSVITGSASGVYRWRRMKSTTPTGGLAVTKRTGEIVLSSDFEFS
jgi:hypothetical protein